MDTKEQIAIMQAYLEGKTIQFKITKDCWMDIIDREPTWNWGTAEYRIKPESTLPTTWKEFCENYPIREGEAYWPGNSSINIYKKCTNRQEDSDKNILPNKELTEAMLALCQLIQLRDCYNQEWQTDWKDDTIKYVIYSRRNKIIGGTSLSKSEILSFKNKELRDEFLKNFKELIEIAKPLL